MAEALRDRYSPAWVAALAAAVAEAQPGFERRAFTRRVLGDGWEELALKQRMRRLSSALHATLPGDYRAQLAVVEAVAPAFGGFEGMFGPDFVEVHGLDDFEASVPALAALTRHSSSEFAVRPFIVRYGEPMMAVMRAWARHPDEHVRRLASEGSRPRLPWAMALTAFQRDPAPTLPILEALRDDPSAYVRRSVANHLNDISKDHPEQVLAIAKRWLGTSARTDALVRHGLRTLLRRGEPRALALLGHHEAAGVRVSGLRLAGARLRIGEDQSFRFVVRLSGDEPAALRLEYAVDFVKAAGHTTRKVFWIGRRTVAPGTSIEIERRHRFRDFSTRRHHAGRHRIAILVNGVERAARTFRLLPAGAPGTDG